MKSRFFSFRCLALFLAFSQGATLFGAAVGGFWEWRNPTPQGNPLYRVTYGEGVYVAVGEAGTILTSGIEEPVEEPPIVTAGTEHDVAPGEAEEWVVRDSRTRQWLTGATFALNQFVVVGNGGRIVTSPDGLEWTCQYSGTDQWLWDVTFFNENFWAVGSGGVILSSPDAVHWHRHLLEPEDLAEPVIGTPFLRSIANNGNKIVAVGDAGTVLYSNDGEIWNQVDWEATDQEIFSAVHSVVFAEGKFIAVGASGLILYSANGEEWDEPAEFVTSDDLWHIIYHVDLEHFFVAGASGLLLGSADGDVWAADNTGVFNTLRSVTPGAVDRFVLVGSGGRIVRSLTEAEKAEMENPPTEDWQDVSEGIRNSLFAAAYGVTESVIDDVSALVGKIVVAADGGRILKTAGEIDPEEFEWSTEWANTSNWLRDITFGDNLFVAVGNNATIRTSENAEEWVSVTPALPGDINGVAFGNGHYITVGRYGRIHRSVPGEEGDPPPPPPDWEDMTPEYDPFDAPADFVARWLRGVAFGNNLFVAVGDRGRILTSADGSAWTPQDLRDEEGKELITAPLYAVAFGHDKFIAVGRNGLMISSPDGVEWTFENSETFLTLHAITYGDGVWITSGDWGTILASYDGEVWFEHNSRTNHSIWGLTYSEDLAMFIAVGDGGTVLTSTEAGEHGLDYWTWIAGHEVFGEESHPTANPSADGLQNLLKFALGLDPNLSQRDLLPLLEVVEKMVDGSREEYLSLLFEEATNVVGVRLDLDGSVDLLDWVSDYWIEVVDEMEGLDLRLVRYQETEPLGAADRRFVRLRATATDRFECTPEPPAEE